MPAPYAGFAGRNLINTRIIVISTPAIGINSGRNPTNSQITVISTGGRNPTNTPDSHVEHEISQSQSLPSESVAQLQNVISTVGRNLMYSLSTQVEHGISQSQGSFDMTILKFNILKLSYNYGMRFHFCNFVS